MAIDTETMQVIERCVARAIANATSLKGAADEISKGVTQYVGARYVPLFAEPLEWDKTKAYEPLTIVLYRGNSYTSRQYVPVGVELTNESFWAETGNYNAQIEQYRQEVKSCDGRITANAQAIDAEKTRAEGAEQTLQANIDAEKTRAEGQENNLSGKINAIENVAVKQYASISDVRTGADNLNIGDTIKIGMYLYKITNDTPNKMDLLSINSDMTASLIIYDYVSPEMLMYGSQDDAAPFINRCLNLARGKCKVILSSLYNTSSTIHMSYKDTIESIAGATINASAYPAIAFDVDVPENYEREIKPFIGNSLVIKNASNTIDNDVSHIGVSISGASEVTFSNLVIYYFGVALDIVDAHNYCINFRDCLIERDYIGVRFNSTEDSGERIAYENCIFGHLYIVMQTDSEISSTNYINCSFDFNQCVALNNKPFNYNTSFVNCHIEGLGYYGSDMPKKQADWYSYLVYDNFDNRYTRSVFSLTNCMLHFNKMQPVLGIPKLVHDTKSTTNLTNCSMSVISSSDLVTYEITDGLCPIGIYRANVALIGSKFLPNSVVNGVYYDINENKATLSYNSEASADLKHIFNSPYFTVNGPSNIFLIDTDNTNANITHNGTYNDSLTGKRIIILKTNLNTIKANLVDSTSKIVFNGIWFLQE